MTHAHEVRHSWEFLMMLVVLALFATPFLFWAAHREAKQRRKRMAEDIPHRLSENDIASLKEWIASWGDKSNWLDPKGEMIPVSKKVLLDLIKDRDEWRRQAMEHSCKEGDTDCG